MLYLCITKKKPTPIPSLKGGVFNSQEIIIASKLPSLKGGVFNSREIISASKLLSL